eukprot:364959-Chlamydomonas_euryale.AAC.13
MRGIARGFSAAAAKPPGVASPPVPSTLAPGFSAAAAELAGGASPGVLTALAPGWPPRCPRSPPTTFPAGFPRRGALSAPPAPFASGFAGCCVSSPLATTAWDGALPADGRSSPPAALPAASGTTSAREKTFPFPPPPAPGAVSPAAAAAAAAPDAAPEEPELGRRALPVGFGPKAAALAASTLAPRPPPAPPPLSALLLRMASLPLAALRGGPLLPPPPPPRDPGSSNASPSCALSAASLARLAASRPSRELKASNGGSA